MKRRTTTAQINEALLMMDVIKAQYYNKDTYTATAIDTATFQENLQFLAEAGILTGCMGWTYEKNSESKGEYIFESGRMNPECNVIATVQMRLKDGVSVEDLEKMLVVEEED